MDDFLIKEISQKTVEKELCAIGFDPSYLNKASEKYTSKILKIYSLTPVQATILKQTALSAGTDCAVHRDVLSQSIEKSDVILFGSISQIKKIVEKLYLQPFNLKSLAQNIEKKIKKTNEQKASIMGILNVTPNSFSDGGEYFDQEKAFLHFSEMIEQGADIIDIGAESTAPKAAPISPEEEKERLSRILPLCSEKKGEVLISVDTRNSLAAEYAVQNGADIINDVSGLMHDERMIDIIKKSKAKVVLTFDDKIESENTLDETTKGLFRRIDLCEKNDISFNRIILDPGLGFNKTHEQNLELIKNAFELCSLGFPVLYGISRKSFIQKITGMPPKDTLEANLAIGAYLVAQGVNILRVHDVKAHKIAINSLEKVLYV